MSMLTTRDGTVYCDGRRLGRVVFNRWARRWEFTFECSAEPRYTHQKRNGVLEQLGIGAAQRPKGRMQRSFIPRDAQGWYLGG